MTSSHRLILGLTLLTMPWLTTDVGAQAAQRAAVPATPARLIPAGAAPAGAIPLQLGGAQSISLQTGTFPSLPPNHFVGQDCSGCHDPVFMSMFEASLANAYPVSTGSSDETATDKKIENPISTALRKTNLKKPRTIDAVLAARRDISFGALEEMPAEDASPTEIASTRANRIALLARAGDWSSYQKEVTACDQEAESVHEVVVQLLAAHDQAMLPEEILDLANTVIPDLQDATPQTDEEKPSQASDEKKLFAGYSSLLAKAASRGSTRTLLQGLERGVASIGGSEPAARARACDLLVGARLHREARPFLDPLAGDGTDSAVLRTRHGQYHIAAAANESDLNKKREHQLTAADLFSSVAEDNGAKTEERTLAIMLLTTLIPELPTSWSDAWRSRIFSDTGAVGHALLANLAETAQQNFQMRFSDPVGRLDLLRTIRSTIASLLTGMEGEPAEWQSSLDALATVFAREAEVSLGLGTIPLPATSKRPQNKIKPAQLADAAPGPEWIQRISPSLRQSCSELSIACYARADEPEKAMDSLRVVMEDPAVDRTKLASVLISEWARNLDPNRPDDEFFENRIITSTGVFISSFGGQRSAPLTRSKQRRSLRYLGEVVAELIQMQIPDLDWDSIVNAFAASHSQAEVYRLEDIEVLFGPLEELPSKVAEQLAMKMWRQLQRNWRSPEIQQSRGTRRTTQELQEEVERGYELGLKLTDHARKKNPTSWNAQMLAGNLRFDLAEYWHELDPDLERYVPQREAAFARYRDSVEVYSKQFNSGIEPRNVAPYMQWFISALGATELGFLTMTTRPENDQVGLLEGSFAPLSEEEQSLHRGLFASTVESSIGSVKADLKSRFVRHAMRIIGDHPLGRGTRRLARLYEDLQSEVQLSVSIDGSNEVGTDPFGVRVALRYTDSLERESGGFDLYLRNQVYVRLAPQPMDYRDDFEARLREAFDEHFVIDALQFNDPDSKPYSFQRAGWMEKSFAYLILKAKDPSVDLLPEVRIDLDFHDGTNGSVRVPVVSAVLPLVATTSSGTRPTAGTNQVEVTLDGRELDAGKVKLEILAQGLGVLPDLDQILPGWKNQAAEAGYSLADSDGLLDNGLNVVKLDPELLPVAPQSERSWTVNLVTTESVEGSTLFHFPSPAEGTDLVCKKYDDFDIVTLEQPVATLEIPSKGLPDWAKMAGAALLSVIVIIGLRSRNQQTGPVAEPRWKMPEDVTPLSVVHLLRSIEAEQALTDSSQMAELREAVSAIESRYFSADAEIEIDHPELQKTAEQWLSRSNN